MQTVLPQREAVSLKILASNKALKIKKIPQKTAPRNRSNFLPSSNINVSTKFLILLSVNINATIVDKKLIIDITADNI